MQNLSCELERLFLSKQCEIEHWLREKWLIQKAPFYGSVDLRNSGYKIAPVDMNLFPGGFNNIHGDFIPLAVQSVSSLIEKYCPHASKILLIPENHTRNIPYLRNVYTLKFILEEAGIEVMIGSLSDEILAPTNMHINDTTYMVYHPIQRISNRIVINNQKGELFDPCLILSNNDFSSGKPLILENLEQTLLPPIHAGWYVRRKTDFFKMYDVVIDEFAKLLDIDGWYLNPFFDSANSLDFAQSIGLDDLANKVDKMLINIQDKYNTYGISDSPYVIVKANSGTYGMGIMSISSSDEILNINRKSRNKMAVIKDGQSVTDVIIQEGVYTIDKINDEIAEPVIYMMNTSVIGGFYRANPKKNRRENLNSSGAHFVPMSLLTKSCSVAKNKVVGKCYIHNVIARLSLLASSMELEIK